jgi:hypothetical protein
MIEKSWRDIFLVVGGAIYVVAMAAWATESSGVYYRSSSNVGEQTWSSTIDPHVRTWRTSQRAQEYEAAIVRVVWLDAGIPRERLSQGLLRPTSSTFSSISGAEISDWF